MSDDVHIRFEKVSKEFPGGVKAVQELSLDVQRGETLVLLGTSGSGKTTTMKMVNRLLEPTGGRILIDDRDIMDHDRIELRRQIGYAIQHIGLFPHMTVGENIATVPRLMGWSPSQIGERVDEMLNMVDLDPGMFRRRYPNQLSGGQRQRIGVARALAADPPIVLMDEPFGALDPITREQLQNEFLELESEIEKTILFVTHDIFEAVRMGRRIALMDEGVLQQLAEPRELVDNPANEFVDSFLGQHRFQLSLLTRTIKTIMPPRSPDSQPVPRGQVPEHRIRARGTLIDALDTFKKVEADVLPVFEGRHHLGDLKKTSLIQAISEVLGQAGGHQ
jgi:osmoprotectant transport system ATP-binding protein